MLTKFVFFKKKRENKYDPFVVEPWANGEGTKMRYEIGIPWARRVFPLVVVIIRGERRWETEMAGPITVGGGGEGGNDDT